MQTQNRHITTFSLGGGIVAPERLRCDPPFLHEGMTTTLRGEPIGRRLQLVTEASEAVDGQPHDGSLVHVKHTLVDNIKFNSAAGVKRVLRE